MKILSLEQKKELAQKAKITIENLGKRWSTQRKNDVFLVVDVFAECLLEEEQKEIVNAILEKESECSIREQRIKDAENELASRIQAVEEKETKAEYLSRKVEKEFESLAKEKELLLGLNDDQKRIYNFANAVFELLGKKTGNMPIETKHVACSIVAEYIKFRSDSVKD